MIKASCRTNLDGFDCSNVTAFVAVPNKEDMVEVKYRGQPAILKVCSITHHCKEGVPYMSVELTGKPRE